MVENNCFSDDLDALEDVVSSCGKYYHRQIPLGIQADYDARLSA